MTETCTITGRADCKDRHCELHYMDAPLKLRPSHTLVIGAITAYVACIPLANWMISEFGIVPIGLGLMAPAGVFAAGLAFGARDLVQRVAGKAWALAAIATGVLLSLLVASPTLALASAAAFAVSELLDMAVFTPLQGRSLAGAVILSNTVGAIADSVVFLLLAFGSLAFLPGQVVGKVLMILPALAVVLAVRRRAA